MMDNLPKTQDTGPMPALQVGTHKDSPGVAAELLAQKFNRHTFWCGQSGSGKTYALGVVLEQLLLHTRLPLVVLDPNADFVRLPEIRPGTPADDAAILDRADIRVLHSAGDSEPRVRVRFPDLELSAKAALLQLDPVADAEEFNALFRVERDYGPQNISDLLPALHASDDPWRRRLGLRLENLRLLTWDVWARGLETVTDVIDQRPQATVVDLGGFAQAPEPKVAALAVLSHLWSGRESRQPVLVVIDEAHNICPAEPLTPLEKILVEQVVQIAAEGRKYGLWLLLSTQRPSKIHPNVLSQCDNLALLRMSSTRDLAELGQVFGYAPEELLRQSPRFRQGQALFAGGFVAEPTIVQIAERLTEEGGSDVTVPLT
jgi:uncharacterized protein